MCGIIGYTGSENVKDVLLDALELVVARKALFTFKEFR